MKKSLRRLFMVLAFLQFPALAGALEAPVSVSHELTSTFQGTTGLSLNYTVHLKNTGESALTDLVLSLVPRPPFITRERVLKLPFLGEGETADLELELLTAQEPDFEAMTFAQLSFAGKGVDAEGHPVEFRLTSFATLMGGTQ
jgi:hypothetical protein